MSFAVAVSLRSEFCTVKSYSRPLHFPWVLPYGPLIETGKFVLCRHSNSPLSPNEPGYGASPFTKHVCVSSCRVPSLIVWTQGVDEFITRGLNIVAWVLVFLLAPETKEYTLEELDSICEFPMLDGCCQSRVLICNSWRPYATIHLPQGRVHVQSHQISGLRPRHCLQRPLHRQTARLRM
jgi:hypothetical protein